MNVLTQIRNIQGEGLVSQVRAQFSHLSHVKVMAAPMDTYKKEAGMEHVPQPAVGLHDQ